MAKDKAAHKPSTSGKKSGKGKASEKDAKKAGKQSSSKVWTVFSLAASVGASTVAKKALNTSWKASTGKTPPENPADPDVALREAIAWAAASGTFVALAKMLATRRAAEYYARSTGHLPPGLEKDEE